MFSSNKRLRANQIKRIVATCWCSGTMCVLNCRVCNMYFTHYLPPSG